MINYVIQNIKKNVRKFIVMFLMLTICSTVLLFTLEVISNLILELGVRSEDLVAKEDLESMIFMLECGISLMIMFVAVIVHNT